MSTTPNNFILTTDFPTLRNDASATGTITIAGGLSIAGNGQVTASADFTVGTTGAIARARWMSSVDGSWYIGQYAGYGRTGTTSGSAAPYTIGLLLYRTSSTTMRLQVIIPNPYSTTLTGAAAETISMAVQTFVPPYAS